MANRGYEGVRVLVVGGGVSGLVAARLAARRGAEVTLVEAAPRLGGAWRALHAQVEGQAIAFDRGIRLGMGTLDDELDHEVYGSLPGVKWHRIDGFPNEGHVFRERLYLRSPCIDLRALPDELRRRALAALMAADGMPGEHLAAQLRGMYGQVIVDTAFRPFLQKALGAELEALAPNAGSFWVPQRFIVADAHESERLRARAGADAGGSDTGSARPAWPSRVAHPDARSLPREGRRFFYPAFYSLDASVASREANSMETWVLASEADLRARGARVETNCRIARVEHKAGRAQCAQTADGRRLDFDTLIWAVSPPLFSRAAGQKTPSLKPRFRDLAVVHLILDRPPATDLAYVTCYDEAHLTHRAAFYREVRPEASPLERRSLSAEVILDPAQDPAQDTAHEPGQDLGDLPRRVHQELRATGLIAEDVAVTWAKVERFGRVFPVPTPELSAGVAACRAEAEARFANVGFVGRTEQQPFLRGILQGCLRTVEAQLAGSRPKAPVAPDRPEAPAAPDRPEAAPSL